MVSCTTTVALTTNMSNSRRCIGSANWWAQRAISCSQDCTIQTLCMDRQKTKARLRQTALENRSFPSCIAEPTGKRSMIWVKLFSNSPDELQGYDDVTNKDLFRGCLINSWQAKLIPSSLQQCECKSLRWFLNSKKKCTMSLRIFVFVVFFLETDKCVRESECIASLPW